VYFVSIAWYLIVSSKPFYRLIMLSIRLNVLKVKLNLLTIELSHIPDLILKLYFFNAIFIRVISLVDFVKNQRITLYQIENSRVVTTLMLCTDYGGKYMLFSLNFSCERTLLHET